MATPFRHPGHNVEQRPHTPVKIQVEPTFFARDGLCNDVNSPTPVANCSQAVLLPSDHTGIVNIAALLPDREDDASLFGVGVVVRGAQQRCVERPTPFRLSCLGRLGNGGDPKHDCRNNLADRG